MYQMFYSSPKLIKLDLFQRCDSSEQLQFSGSVVLPCSLLTASVSALFQSGRGIDLGMPDLEKARLGEGMGGVPPSLCRMSECHDDIWKQNNFCKGGKLAGGFLLIMNVMVSWNNGGSGLVTSTAQENTDYSDKAKARSFLLFSRSVFAIALEGWGKNSGI